MRARQSPAPPRPVPAASTFEGDSGKGDDQGGAAEEGEEGEEGEEFCD